MQKFFEQFAAIIGAITVSIVAMSVSHEYGYFIVIGRDFETLLSTTDYFSNAVVWLPYAPFFLYAWVDLPFVRDPKLMRTPNVSGWKSWLWPTFLFVGAVILPIGSFFFAPIVFAPAYLIGFVYIWAKIGDTYIPFKKDDPDELPSLFYKVMRFGLPILAAMFTLGWIDGNSDLT